MGLDSVEIILTVEEEFGLEIPDAEAARMITVGDLQARDIICRQLGLKPDAVIPAARFVKDLGVD